MHLQPLPSLMLVFLRMPLQVAGGRRVGCLPACFNRLWTPLKYSLSILLPRIHVFFQSTESGSSDDRAHAHHLLDGGGR